MRNLRFLNNPELTVAVTLLRKSAIRRTDFGTQLSFFYGGLWGPTVWRLLGPKAFKRIARNTSNCQRWCSEQSFQNTRNDLPVVDCAHG